MAAMLSRPQCVKESNTDNWSNSVDGDILTHYLLGVEIDFICKFSF